MRPLKEGVAVLVVLGLVLAAACNKGPAEEALAAAEGLLDGARGDLERFAPEELSGLGHTLDEARADLAEGHYTDALRAAQELPSRIHRAIERANRRKEAELVAAWNEVSRGLPALLGGLRARLAGLAPTPNRHTALDDARLEEARAELRDIVEVWSQATAAFEGGDIPRALKIAQRCRPEQRSSGRGWRPRPPRWWTTGRVLTAPRFLPIFLASDPVEQVPGLPSPFSSLSNR